MKIECNLQWEFCQCDDCIRARKLFEELMWYESQEHSECFEYEMIQIINELENMGYSC